MFPVINVISKNNNLSLLLFHVFEIIVYYYNLLKFCIRFKSPLLVLYYLSPPVSAD